MKRREKSRRALFIGRFQPFHLGHLHAVKYILSKAEHVIIGIGSALESHTARNPFTAAERTEMIELSIAEAGLERNRISIIPIPDIGIHRLWPSLVEILVPPIDIVFTNDPLTATLFRERKYRVEPIPFLQRGIFSGTEFRRRVVKGEDWRQLVPKSVAIFLEKERLVDRIKVVNS